MQIARLSYSVGFICFFFEQALQMIDQGMKMMKTAQSVVARV